jgi:hypothetical protein
MINFFKSLDLSDEIKVNEIYDLFKSNSSELNLKFLSSLQKFNNVEELINYYTKENSKNIFNIFTKLSSISSKIYKNSENSFNDEEYITGISNTILLILIIQKNLIVLNDILNNTKNYIKKYPTNISIKINNYINNLIDSTFFYTQKNNSRRSTKDSSIITFSEKKVDLNSDDEEVLFYSEINTPKFEEENNNNEKNIVFFESIKNGFNKEETTKKFDSSLTLEKMNFAMNGEVEPLPQLEKTKSHDIYKISNNINKKSKKNKDTKNKKKLILYAFLNQINNLYKEKKINSMKKIELKQLIISDNKFIFEKFNNFDNINKNNINDNIKIFLSNHLKTGI